MKPNNRTLRWYSLSIFFVGLGCLFFSSCDKKQDDVLFRGDSYQNILQYIDDEPDKFSKFKKLIEVGNLEGSLSSYNSHLGGTNYSLFLPDDEAVDLFVDENNRYDSFEELLSDINYVKSLVRYHVLNEGILSVDFPNGAFNAKTLSNDFLTVNFRSDADDVIDYKINDEASVIDEDIIVANGIIHVIDKMLTPVVYTAYEWIQVNKSEGFQIFAELLEITGMEDTMSYSDLDEYGDVRYPGYTVMAESDELYSQNGISSLEDLIDLVSPDNTDYTNSNNKLNKFVKYHILESRVFLDQFEASNYNTYGEFPISVDIPGVDLHFNVGSKIYEIEISGEDTTEIDYIEIDVNKSNILTKTGPIHQLNRVLFPFRPPRKTIELQFYNEPNIRELSGLEGTFRINEEQLQVISLFGPDFISYTKSNKNIRGVTNNDYLSLSGDFEFVYQTPSILAGTYELQLIADRSSSENAMIQVFVDNEKAGQLINLTSGSARYSNFLPEFVLALVSFEVNGTHEIRIKTVKPGRLYLDGMILIPR